MSFSKRWSNGSILVACGLLGFGSPVAEAGLKYDVRAFVRTGDGTGPGLEPGTTFLNLNKTASLNSRGEVVFNATLAGPSVTSQTNRGIFLSRPGMRPELIARTGYDAAGATPGTIHIEFADTFTLDDDGGVAFSGQLAGIDVNTLNDTGIWLRKNATTRKVQRENDPAPGTGPDVRFSAFGRHAHNVNGEAVFVASLRGPGISLLQNSSGFWAEAGGSGTLLIARAGDNPVGMEPGLIFTTILAGVNIDRHGASGFVGNVTLPGSAVSGQSGIWEWQSSVGASLQFRTGGQAPGANPGVLFESVTSSSFNRGESGRVAAILTLQGPTVTVPNRRGLWAMDREVEPRLIAREGFPAPGTEPFTNYNVIGDPAMNDSGQIAFRATLLGFALPQGRNVGIFTSNGVDPATLLVRKGDSAPGTLEDAHFGEFLNPILNVHGQVAFEARLWGPGVTSSSSQSIWATDLQGRLVMIARAGDLIDVDPDPNAADLRLIRAISFLAESSATDGQRRSFNDSGQITFAAEFGDDSSGIFVVQVPEPVSIGTLGVTGVLTLRRRRHCCLIARSMN
jgi:hypothetical protein